MGRRKGSKNIPWDSIVARLRKHPGRWMLLPEMRSVDPAMVDIIRSRRRRQLQMSDGRIYCRQKAIAQLEDGTLRCTLMLRFIPREDEKDHGA